jgi:hypothetical protein
MGLVGRAFGLEGWDGTLQALDGQFALFLEEEHADRVTLATDAFGMQSLFVARAGDHLLFSTSALALATHLRAAPSDVSLKMFLRAGYLIGPLTLWEGVERLEPGGALVVERGVVSARTYYRPQTRPAGRSNGLGRAVGASAEAVRTTCASHLGASGEIWADLTGGFDTRLLCVALDAAGVRFRTNTVGPPESADVLVAERVAAAARWKWQRLGPPYPAPRDAESWAELGARWGDGSLPMLEVGRVLATHALKADSGPRALAIGGAFEHARGDSWQQEFVRAGHTSVVNMDNWVRMRCIHPLDMQVFTSDFTGEVEQEFRERMSSWASPYRDELNTTQLDVMSAYKRTGHFGAWTSAARSYIEPEMPAYYKNIFEVLFSTSPRLRRGYRLQRHLIDHFNPGVAAVTTANGGPAAPMRSRNVVRFAPAYGRLVARAARKATEWRGRPSAHGALAPREHVDEALHEAGRLGLPHSTSAGEFRLERLVRPASLGPLLGAVRERDGAALRVLDRVMTVEWSLRASAP